MAKKRSHTSRAVEPPEANDLKFINGIGPGVESRLHSVGIFTFAQLAALSPVDVAASVAGLAGLTAERIIKQDWLGQARELAAKTSLTEPEWIDQARELALTSTLPASQNGTEVRVDSQQVTTFTQAALEERTPATAKQGLTGVLHLRQMQIVTVSKNGHHSILRNKQPFEVRLNLDPTDQVGQVDALLS